MSQHVPFPHVLSSKIEASQGILRLVSDTADVETDTIVQYDGVQQNPKTVNLEPVYNIWKFTEIKERRPAKGDWSGWPSHPTYYSGMGSLVKRDFLCNLGEYSSLIANASKDK